MPGPFALEGPQPNLDTPSFRAPEPDVGGEADVRLNRELAEEQLRILLRWNKANPVHGPIAKSQTAPRNPLAEQIRFLFEKLPDPRIGLPFSELNALVLESGAEAVGVALRSLGKVTISAHRVYLLDPLVKAFNTAFTSGSGYSSEGPQKSRVVPAGTKKLWNDRIMEKGHDGKWHMVGRAKGHQTTFRKPDQDAKPNVKRKPKPESKAADFGPQEPVDPHQTQLSTEEAADLIRKMIRLHHASKRIQSAENTK